MKLSLLIPVYNERRTLREIVERILAQALPGVDERELVIVDDASTDGCGAILQELALQHPEIKAVFQLRNQGKGAAIRTAIAQATGDLALIQDADLEYDPADYPQLLAPLLRGEADVVYGSRFIFAQERPVLSFKHTLLNKLLTTLSNLFTDLYLTDMETCYKAFWLKTLKTIPLRSDRFGLEPEITAKIAKRCLRVFEVPVRYHGRTYAEGKKITWKDGLQALGVILQYWLIDDIFEPDYGRLHLTEMQTSPRFTSWIVQQAAPYLGERTLEIQSGLGHQTRHLALRAEVLASDPNEKYVEFLRQAFPKRKNIRVVAWDSIEPPPADLPSPDSIFCAHFLEMLEDDRAPLHLWRQVLPPEGRLILVLPQGKSLFCALDTGLGHRRRYDQSDLESLLEETGYMLEEAWTFNKLGVTGWLLRGHWMKAHRFGKLGLKLYDVAVPLVRLLDRWLPGPGLSWMVIAKKK